MKSSFERAFLALAVAVAFAGCGGAGTTNGAPAPIPGFTGSSEGSPAPSPVASGTLTPAPQPHPGGTGISATPTSTPTAASGTTTDERSCLWAADSTEVNTLFPDTGATYYVATLPIPPGGSVRFDGTYAHARYLSFNVYNPLLQPTDSLNDQFINPSSGSTNPFLAGANRNVTTRSYSLRLIQSVAPAAPATRPSNTLYAGQTIGSLSASQNEAVVIYRVYVPDSGTDATGGTGLPHITLVTSSGQQITGNALCSYPAILDGSLPNLANVPDVLSDVPLNTGAYQYPLWLKFFDLQSSEVSRVYGTPLGPAVYESVGSPTSGSGGFASNADNRYIYAAISESLGNVVAIHAQLPKTPMTFHGEATMGTGDMRYWSICSNDQNLTTVFACLYDEQVTRDAEGRGVILVSMPADRPANATAACGVSWLDWGTSDNGLLIYRNMLPEPQTQFPNAIQYVPGPPGQHEAAVMGAYYPYAAHMMRAQFEALGCPVSADQLPSVVSSPPASS